MRGSVARLGSAACSTRYDRGALNRLDSPFFIAWLFRASAWTLVAWLLGWRGVLVLAVLALVTQAAALAVHQRRAHASQSAAIVGGVVAFHVAVFLSVLRPELWPVAMPAGIGVFLCHAVSYLVDVRRGLVDPRRHLAAVLYLLQLPVFPSGPLSRFHDFDHQLSRTDVSMAGFSYGVRRISQGLTKVYLVAGPLGTVAGRIFALPVTKLSTDSAWLGAVCVGLEVYFYLSGFSDVGIGLGKMVGLRYQENFRRPYTADSIREFWRRWNVTLITWLRDYVSLPIAGHERGNRRLYVLTIVGFVLVGLWTETSLNVLPWAVYCASWLAIEAAGLGRLLTRLPRALRHVYVLLVVLLGWVLLRASGPGPLLGYLEAMVGASIAPFGASAEYFTLGFSTALVSALVFAGPLVGNLSRWRVSVDSAVASLLMMFAATGILLWHAANGVRRLYELAAGTKTSRPRQ